MARKKEKKIDLKNLTPDEKMKFEIAAELGLFERVMTDGWGGLTARETGRIGGLMTSRKKAEKKR
ncbi:MAG: small, acid-soluble spore protein, alpha/beta type [Catenibacillus sp.]